MSSWLSRVGVVVSAAVFGVNTATTAIGSETSAVRESLDTRTLVQSLPAPEVTVRFASGDRLQATITALDEDDFHLQAGFLPEQRLVVPRERVTGFSVVDNAEPNAVGDHRLLLHGGSSLIGSFVGFVGEGLLVRLRFVSNTLGVLEIPLDSVAELTLAGNMPQPRGEAATVIITNEGDLLVGALEILDDGDLVVHGRAMQAQLNVSAIAAVLHQPPERMARRGDGVLLRLVGGEVLLAADVRSDANALTIVAEHGEQLHVPLNRVDHLALISGTGVTGVGDVVVWGGYADRDEEYTRALGIVSDGLPAISRVHEMFSRTIDDELVRALGRARVLVIPEWEDQMSDPGVLGQAFAPHVERFLLAGGRVVVLGADASMCEFLRSAGIVDASYRGRADHEPIALGPGAPPWLATDLVGTITSTNGTNIYRITELESEWASVERGTVVVGSQVGRGEVVLLGMDLFQTNPEVNQLVHNAIFGR